VAEVHRRIRRDLIEMAGEQKGRAIRVLYGGSVKPDNAAELLNGDDVNGALVGGASLKAADFIGIIKAYA
jgi:triosephosphate isomerase (TIM)